MLTGSFCDEVRDAYKKSDEHEEDSRAGILLALQAGSLRPCSWREEASSHSPRGVYSQYDALSPVHDDVFLEMIKQVRSIEQATLRGGVQGV